GGWNRGRRRILDAAPGFFPPRSCGDRIAVSGSRSLDCHAEDSEEAENSARFLRFPDGAADQALSAISRFAAREGWSSAWAQRRARPSSSSSHQRSGKGRRRRRSAPPSKQSQAVSAGGKKRRLRRTSPPPCPSPARGGWWG